jgi:putative aldouronate transport system permease protein
MKDSFSERLKKFRLKHFNSDLAFNLIVGTLLTFVTIMLIIPLLYVVNASFSDADFIFSGNMLWLPGKFNIEGYKLIFSNKDLVRGFSNSVFYSILAVVVSVPFTVMAAYPLSRPDFVGKKLIMIVYTITMFFGAGLVPSYLLMTSLGLYDSPLALVLPGVSVWNIIVVRQYFVTRVGKELFEAAKIDGCSNWQFFWRIGAPLAKPIIMVISTYVIVGQWNSYFSPMVYLSDRSKYPLQLILRELLLSADGSSDLSGFGGALLESQINALEAMRYSSIILSAIPIIILYVIVQKQFEEGVMVGSLKG